MLAEGRSCCAGLGECQVGGMRFAESEDITYKTE
jgi:hypothetical protein